MELKEEKTREVIAAGKIQFALGCRCLAVGLGGHSSVSPVFCGLPGGFNDRHNFEGRRPEERQNDDKTRGWNN